MYTWRKIKISVFVMSILEGIFLNMEMRCDVAERIYDDVANALKDVKYDDIYISAVQDVVEKILYDKIMTKICY